MNFKTFYINNYHICYQEVPSDTPFFEKFYLMENPEQADIIAIPDGSIDFEFICENGCFRGYVCGSFLHGKKSLISNCRLCFGMRLRPNMRFRFLERNVEHLVDRRVPLSEFLDVLPLEKRLSSCRSLTEMIDAAQRFFGDRPAIATPIIACSAEQLISKSPHIQRISDVVNSMGYTQQYVNNIFRQNYGVSLKKYSDIVRIQVALNYLETNDGDVMDVITNLGYYDQAHFIRDFKQYTSLTPKRFIDIVCNQRECTIV